MEFESFECSTCQICLYGITNFQRHVNSMEHANKIQSKNITDEDKLCSSSDAAKQVSSSNMLVESVGKSAGINGSPYLKCELCQKQFTGNEPYQQHLASAGHKKKLAMSSNQSNHLGPLRCEVCDKFFSGPAPYEQHMTSSIHKKKVLDMELQRGNLFASLHAQPETDIKSHVQSQDYQDTNHLKSSVQVNNLQGHSIQNGVGGWTCDICDKCFSGHLPYEQHMNSNVHIKKLKERKILNDMLNKTCTAESLLDNKGSDMSSAHFISQLKCEVCDKSFSGPVPYDQHMNSQVHQKKVKDKDMLKHLLNSDQVDSTHDNEKTSVLFNYTSDNGKTSEFRDNICSPNQLLSTNQSGLLQFKCEVCDKCFNGRIPFDQHISSVNHQKKVLQKTPQLNGENKNVIDVFSINCTPKNEIPGSQNWFCKICNKQCSGSVPFNQHIMSDAHCKKIRVFEMEENVKEMKDLDSANPTLITEDADEMSIDDNCLNSEENGIDGMSPETRQINSDLICDDVLKDLNFITPETLNVTTFKANENIVFDIALK